ncbi:glycosyltransferase [Paenibacillus sp. A3]|uniref:glycosyltransferase n=1 Tax=Paenibacillus sp. A3 TaxID=1337054 RepID=UPI0009ECB32B|nr:glycosyltransferase [Paenibacillus sp. A3]
MMRICYVSFEYPPQFGGGIGTYVGNISRNLASQGHEIHVLTFNPENLPDQENILGVNVHRIKMDGPQMEVINNADSANLSTLLYWSHYSEKVYWKLKELTNRYSFDIVEFCDYRGEGYFSMLAKRTRGEFRNTKLIVRLHTPLFVLNKYNSVINDPGMEQLVQFENFSMLLADEVVSPSNVLAKMTVQELALKKNIEIVPHPIDIESIAINDYVDSNTLLYVGRLELRKGVKDLVIATINLMTKYPELELKFIGGDTNSAPDGSSMKLHLQSLIPKELKKRVHFIDRLPREEVLKEYSKSKVSIFPSLFENFPNVCLEAMASSVPVIVSDFSGMAEMVEDKKSGIIFEAGNIKDLLEKLEYVCKLSFEERKNMGLHARKRVEDHYSVQAINKLQENYFNNLKGISKKNRSTNYEKGLVSVIIPCYNHGKFIEETIESIKKNTYKNFEIIIVNDGSTDEETLKVLDHVEKSGVKVLHQENSGLSAARNTGINTAIGEFILPLDADDIIDPLFFEKTVEAIQKDENIGFVYTYVQFFGAASGIWKTPEFDPNLLLISNLCVASSLFRHDAFDQIGGYKEDMTFGFEDWDFWIYMVENGWKGKCIPEPLFFYRKHQESMLSNSQKNRSYLIEKLVEHHYTSYQKSLSYVVVEKDKMFFDAHMSNYYNFSELNSIKGSKAWKFVITFRKIKDRVRKVLGGRR